MSKGGNKSFIREILELIDKYGVFRIIGAVIMMLFISYATYLSFNPSILFERYEKYELEQHYEMFDYRMNSIPYVQTNLNSLLHETDATRAYIIELHNGKSNSAGLSFNYGTLTYESNVEGSYSIREDYTEFSLERYPLLVKIYHDGFWCGNVEELSLIDKRLAHKMCANDGAYLAIAMIYGIKSEIGFLGITFSQEPEDKTNLRKILAKHSSMISPLLDGEKAKQERKKR